MSHACVMCEGGKMHICIGICIGKCCYFHNQVRIWERILLRFQALIQGSLAALQLVIIVTVTVLCLYSSTGNKSSVELSRRLFPRLCFFLLAAFSCDLCVHLIRPSSKAWSPSRNALFSPRSAFFFSGRRNLEVLPTRSRGRLSLSSFPPFLLAEP